MTRNWLLIPEFLFSSSLLLSLLLFLRHHRLSVIITARDSTQVCSKERRGIHMLSEPWIPRETQNHVILVNKQPTNQINSPSLTLLITISNLMKWESSFFYKSTLRRPARTSALINGRINLLDKKGVIFPPLSQPSHHPQRLSLHPPSEDDERTWRHCHLWNQRSLPVSFLKFSWICITFH